MKLVAGTDTPCPYCGASPRPPAVDWEKIKDGHIKEVLVKASLTVKLYPCGCLEKHDAERQAQEEWSRKLKTAQIPPRYWKASLIPTGKSEYESEFIAVCRDYLLSPTGTGGNDEKPRKQGLGLIGSIGTGKTYFLCAMLMELMRVGRRCLFVNLPEFYTQLKSTFGDEGTPEYSRLITEAKEIEILGLDEVGQRKLSPWGIEEIYGVVNYRYNHNLGILFTTSKTIRELEINISRDTVDRIWEMCQAYEINGFSLRRGKIDGREK